MKGFIKLTLQHRDSKTIRVAVRHINTYSEFGIGTVLSVTNSPPEEPFEIEETPEEIDALIKEALK